MKPSRPSLHAEEVRRRFDEVVDLPPKERAARLEQIGREDAALRRQIEALLAADDKAGTVLGRYGPLLREVRDAAMRSAPEEQTTPRVGQSVAHYTLLERLGEGGMGEVFKARDVRLGRTAALKFLSVPLSRREEAKRRFLQEAQAVSGLDHPNICTIYEVGETDAGQPFIAMACYEGETLKARIARGPLPVEEAVDVAVQMAEGLRRAHAAGVVHRDIKPANVMLTEGGRVKLLDFGIAKVADADLTRTGQRLGTVAYMSPEQTRGEPVDRRTDLWSLGAVLYEMLAGRPPFAGEHAAAVGYAVVHEEPPPLREVRPDAPEALAQVVRTALQKRPEARYQHAEDVLAALRAVRKKRPAVGAATGRLPAPLTGLIGREDEIEQILTLLSETRLLTLTGPAGTGKTRLSLEVANRLAGRFVDGIFFVPLDALTEPDLVAPAIAHALDVVETASRPVVETLKEALRHRQLLLILDNFEQVAAAAPVVAELLAACSELKMLVTSRMPLHLSGEQEFLVPPLAVPPVDEPATVEALQASSAVRLFVERARAVRPDFALTDDNAAAVGRLCAHLDGLPLAIELAAARIKLFSPQAMLARLGRQLDLLKGGPHDRPTRHQTLRRAIDWSYHLLDEAERRFFRRASAFAGGFTLEAAEAVCRSGGALGVLDAVEGLVEQSLLLREESADGEPRFRMLETLRAYGLERLGESGEAEATREAHLRFFTGLAERAEAALNGTEAVVWLDRLDEEHNNLRVALAWAVESGDAEAGQRLGAALSDFWSIRGHLHEGRQRLMQVLDVPGADASSPLRAKILNGLGMLIYLLGDFREAEARLEESLALWRQIGDPQGIANALNDLTWVAMELSDADKAQRLADETLALCRRHGDRRGTAIALYNLGWLENYRGHYWNARNVLEESVYYYRAGSAASRSPARAWRGRNRSTGGTSAPWSTRKRPRRSCRP